MAIRNRICGLPSGLVRLTAAHAQPPARTDAGNGPPPTTCVFKINFKAGKNADFYTSLPPWRCGVPAKGPGNTDYELYHLAKNPQTHMCRSWGAHSKDAAAVATHGKTFIVALARKDLLDGPLDAHHLIFVESK